MVGDLCPLADFRARQTFVLSGEMKHGEPKVDVCMPVPPVTLINATKEELSILGIRVRHPWGAAASVPGARVEIAIIAVAGALIEVHPHTGLTPLQVLQLWHSVEWVWLHLPDADGMREPQAGWIRPVHMLGTPWLGMG